MRDRCYPLHPPYRHTKHKIEEAEVPFSYDGEIDYKKVDSDEYFGLSEGVYEVYEKIDKKKLLFKPNITFLEHYSDYKQLTQIIRHAACKSFCFSRLNFLSLKFKLYKEMYSAEESDEQKEVPHRDFYNVRKVDNHIHLSSAMNQKFLLSFIKKKIRSSPDLVVIKEGKVEKTLKQVFEEMNLTTYDLNVDLLDVYAGKSEFHRFDKFNAKFSPFGTSSLRNIFLKTDNHIKGKFFSEICHTLFKIYERNKYQLMEVRISIYGRKKNELAKIAHWVFDNKLHSPSVRWIIQIPRLFDLNCKRGNVKTFQDMLENIFEPFFDYTRNPEKDPVVSTFLEHFLVAFDTVDDESKVEPSIHSGIERPDVWGNERKDNPCYQYYCYYLYANINVLNQYRSSKGMSTYTFRPHSGEAGDISHLTSSFLLAESINHGINLRLSPVLQYLYYLTQIGLSVAPLSNNKLFLGYKRNPFPHFFQNGLNVTLSTDDPLMFHFTREPLMEEYSVAQQIMNLSAADICEIARNSVLQSDKQYWISRYYKEHGIHSNNIKKTNVPTIRVQYRHETLLEEHLYIQSVLIQGKKRKKDKRPSSPFITLAQKEKYYEDLRKHRLQLFARENQMEFPINNLKIPRNKFKFVKTPTRYSKKTNFEKGLLMVEREKKEKVKSIDKEIFVNEKILKKLEIKLKSSKESIEELKLDRVELKKRKKQIENLIWEQKMKKLEEKRKRIEKK